MEFHPVRRTKDIITSMGNGLARLAGVEQTVETNEESSAREYSRIAYELGMVTLSQEEPVTADRHHHEYYSMTGTLNLVRERERQIAAKANDEQ